MTNEWKSDYGILCDLRAKQAISEALIRNSRGIDRCDIDLLKSAYHDDAHIEHGPFIGSVEGFANWMLLVQRKQFSTTSHFVSNIYIEINNLGRARATAETYFHTVSRFERNEQHFDRIELGRYVDHFESRNGTKRCQSGTWKIARRIAILDSHRIDPVAEKHQDANDYDPPIWGADVRLS